MTKLQQEPVTTATIVPIITFLALRFGLEIDTATATAIATVILVVGQAIARQLSTPVTKAEKRITEAYYAEPGTDAKPTL